MKKIAFIISLLIVILAFPLAISADNTISREINIVYDDSSSMIKDDNNQYVDYWAKAKYSLQLLTASTSVNDTINIYPMSQYSNQLTKDIQSIDDYESEIGPKLSLNANMTIEDRVKAVNNMVTDALNTPFMAVGKAFLDLTKSSADEKWLVILTDGKFDQISSEADLNQKLMDFKDYDNDVKIMYLGMNSSAFKVAEDEDLGIYSQYVDDSNELLSSFANISYRIFNRNQLDISQGHRMEFDVPMKKIVVFAQGEGASLGSLIANDGSELKPSSQVIIPVNQLSALNFQADQRVISDSSLTGALAEYDYNISEGNYRVEVENSDSVEVFYYPNVGLKVNLLDSSNNNVYGQEAINSGSYTVEYKFINKVTNEEINDTKLLGEITFKAKLFQNGMVIQDQIENGSTINLVTGQETLLVSANYLKYNTVENKLNLNVVNHKLLQYQVVSQPDYKTSFFSKGNLKLPFQVSIKLDGRDVSELFWKEMPLPVISSTNLSNLNFSVEKSQEKGLYNVYIDSSLTKLNNIDNIDINILGSYDDSQIFYKGQQVSSLVITNNTPLILRLVINYWPLIIILLLVIGLIIALFYKSLPKIIYLKINKILVDNNKVDLEYQSHYYRKDQNICLEINPYSIETEKVTLYLKATESLLMAKLTNPKILAIKKIEASNLVKEVIIGKARYIKVNNDWILEKYEYDNQLTLKEKQELITSAKKIKIKLENGSDFLIFGEIQRY